MKKFKFDEKRRKEEVLTISQVTVTPLNLQGKEVTNY